MFCVSAGAKGQPPQSCCKISVVKMPMAVMVMIVTVVVLQVVIMLRREQATEGGVSC